MVIIMYILYFIMICWTIGIVFWVTGKELWTVENFILVGLIALVVWFLYKKSSLK